MTLAAERGVGAMTGEARMLAACRREPVDATPVWFMRQAGRCLPGYRALRQSRSMLQIAREPDLCARVTLMPVEQLGVDGAVIYADIMTLPEGMGVALDIVPEVGPVIEHPVRTLADVERLRPIEPEESVGYLLDAIRQVRSELSDGRAAVLGFGGSPFTIACYLVEGRPSREYQRVRSVMLREPALWHALMERLAEASITYLGAQVQAGAQVIQLFDSWIGALSATDFDQFVLPYVQRIFDGLRPLGVPTIYFGTGNAHLLERMAAAGSDIVSVDWRQPLDEAWARIGFERGIQGNLDPVRPLAGWEATEAGLRDVLRRAGNRPGHVFNLGHGVYPETDPAVLARLANAVHEETRR